MQRLFYIIFSIFLIASLCIGCTNSQKAATNTSSGSKLHTITAPKGGKIIGLIVEKGERISKDQPLFAIADEQLSKELEKNSADLAAAEAKLKVMQNGSSAPNPVNITALKERQRKAQENAAKMERLLAVGGISRAKAVIAQQELQQSNNALAAAQQQTEASKPASPEAIEAQEKQIASLKAQQNVLISKQQENEVMCPATGVIKEIKVTNGTVLKLQQIVLVLEEIKE